MSTIDIARTAQAVVAGIAERADRDWRAIEIRIQELVDKPMSRAGISVGRDHVGTIQADAGKGVVLARGRIYGQTAGVPEQRSDVPVVERCDQPSPSARRG